MLGLERILGAMIAELAHGSGELKVVLTGLPSI
jgi:hypothetical protein